MTGRLGIVGATGWLGQALGLNLLRQGWPAGDLVLMNRSGSRAAYDGHPVVWARDMGHMFDLCDTVVLSVRPEDFPVPGFAPGGQLLISFMAAVPAARLQSLAPRARIVRAMPNGGAPVGQSYTPWCAGDLSDADVALTRRILSAIGTEDRVASEDQLDILSAISGSGSAYPALMAQAMLDSARGFGLPEDVALRAVESVICGSAPFLAGKLSETASIIEAYKSYRGITAAGLDAATGAGFEDAVKTALAAAVAKARSMGR
ncbi:MAG: pyrroline-5-carboxylate reductase dimerization domain-containing protein [Paracoccaceae bacterium]